MEDEMLKADEAYQKAKQLPLTDVHAWQDMDAAREANSKGEKTDQQTQAEHETHTKMSGLRKSAFYPFEQSNGGSFEPEDPAEKQKKLDAELKDDIPQTPEELCRKIRSSDNAFVVFNSEAARDAAVGDWGAGDGAGLDLGAFGHLDKMTCEPDTIQWKYYGESTPAKQTANLMKGIGKICLALFFWTTVFYTPYAYQVFCFNYENGAQPPFTLALTFCMVVVAGNGIMYQVCAIVAEDIGFKTRDEKESCYLILYVVACMFNVTLDMVTTYFLSVYILGGLGFRTYDGVKIQDLPNFNEKFESYAMQRLMSENTKCYCFPATFLIPFLLEPFITCIVPYMAGKKLVVSHPEWVGRDSELLMSAWEFDMGRYGDLLLNMLLGMLIFFFPGGYTLILFFGMSASHAYIYFFDHWRVLCVIPKVCYASINVDWWACWMMAPITAMIPMCLVFTMNCQNYGYCLRGAVQLEVQVGTYILHTVVHTLLFVYMVPTFTPDYTHQRPPWVKEDIPEEDWEEHNIKYDQNMESLACNWFTANPIHCLRSHYLKTCNGVRHSGTQAPVNYFMLGKAHLLSQNDVTGGPFPEGKAENFSRKKKTEDEEPKEDTAETTK